jgi:PhnB protein
MSNAVKAVPDGYHSLTPYLTCKDTARAIEFYKKAFGAKLDMQMPGPDGKIIHAEIQIGNSKIFLGEECPGRSLAPDPNSSLAPVSIFFYTDNVDAVFDRAVQEGSKVAAPLQDQFWGDRFGKLVDPFGHHWALAQHIEDVAPDEMKRRSDAAMAAAG